MYHVVADAPASAVSDRVDMLAESYDVFNLAHADGSPKYLAALRFVLWRP